MVRRASPRTAASSRSAGSAECTNRESQSANSCRAIGRAPKRARCSVSCWQSMSGMSIRASMATSLTSATLDASVSRANIDSPKNIRPIATPYRPPTSSPSRQDSTECAWPCAVQRRVGIDHRRRDPGSALPVRAAPRSRPSRPGMPCRRGSRSGAGARRGAASAATLNSSTNSTIRGSGLHHRIGWPRCTRGRCRADRRRAGARATGRRPRRAARSGRRARRRAEETASRNAATEPRCHCAGGLRRPDKLRAGRRSTRDNGCGGLRCSSCGAAGGPGPTRA